MGTYILPTSLYRSLLHLLEELYLLEVLCFLGVRVRSLRARVTLGPNIHAHAEKEKRALPDFIRWGPGYESVYLWDLQHKTHIFRKSTPNFTKSSSFVLIGPILNKMLQNLQRNVWIAGQVSGNPYIC